MQRVLVVDDDPAGRRLLQAALSIEGWTVASADDGPSGLALADSGQPDLVILDLRLPGIDGLEVLSRLRLKQPSLPVIILTAFGEVRTAVEATKRGAFDYLTKPVDLDQLILASKRALETRALRMEVEELRRTSAAGGGLGAQMGRSSSVQRVIEQVRSVADTTFSVLVSGETGTGKELVAQAIHRQSSRRERPFVAIDCGAIPEALIESELFGHEKGAFTGAQQRRHGQFRLADGGTLFLDEVGNLPQGLQAKLLRVLESRKLQALGATTAAPLDVRVVAATNRDLQRLSQEGLFRADLYFRLAQYGIQLPALRERREDIPYLAQKCLEEVSVELRRPTLGIARDAIQALQRYEWPGNVRELRNVVRQAVLESNEPTLKVATVNKLLLQRDVSGGVAAEQQHLGLSLRDAVRAATRDAERRIISDALRQAGGNQAQAARLLRTDYKTLYLKLKQLGLRGRDFSA